MARTCSQRVQHVWSEHFSILTKLIALIELECSFFMHSRCMSVCMYNWSYCHIISSRTMTTLATGTDGGNQATKRSVVKAVCRQKPHGHCVGIHGSGTISFFPCILRWKACNINDRAASGELLTKDHLNHDDCVSCICCMYTDECDVWFPMVLRWWGRCRCWFCCWFHHHHTVSALSLNEQSRSCK